MKRTLLALGVAALALPAAAQYSESQGISLRAGVFFPSDSGAKQEGNTWLGIGVDYKLKDLNQRDFSDRPWTTSLAASIDYYGKGDYSAVPILLNYVGRTEQFYFSGGAGLAFVDAPANDDIEFAFQISAGLDFPTGDRNLFAELRYWGVTGDLNGLGLYGGIRF